MITIEPNILSQEAREAASPGAQPPGTALLVRLGEVLHRAGAPAPRLEEAVEKAAGRLGLRAAVFSTPTSLFLGIGEGFSQRTFLERVHPGEVNLGKLVDLDELLEQQGDSLAREPERFAARLESVAAAPPRYGPIATVLGFGLASSTAARFFGGGAAEVAVSALLGLLVGTLALITGRSAATSRIFEHVAALLATSLAVVAAWASPPMAYEIVTLATLIVLVPGFTLTVGMSEIASRHWVSGATRLAGAGMAFLSIGLGVALATPLRVALLGTEPPVPSAALPTWTLWVGLLLSPIAFGVLFQARMRDFGVILAAGALGFFGARAGAHLLGPELGTYVGALALGLGSNLYARLARRPAQVPQVPGLILLVPGALGFRGVSSFLVDDPVSGIESVFRMALVAVSLVGGLLVANALLSPKRSL